MNILGVDATVGHENSYYVEKGIFQVSIYPLLVDPSSGFSWGLYLVGSARSLRRGRTSTAEQAAEEVNKAAEKVITEMMKVVSPPVQTVYSTPTPMHDELQRAFARGPEELQADYGETDPPATEVDPPTLPRNEIPEESEDEVGKILQACYSGEELSDYAVKAVVDEKGGSR